MTKHDWRAEFNRLEGAYAPKTIKSYHTDLRAYEAWCAEQGCEMFPAPVAQLCEFLQDQCAGVTAATVCRRLYAIRKAHQLLRLPDPTQDEDINLALRRVRRTKGTRRVQATGMTETFLIKFIASEPDTPTGWRNRAMMSLGYDLLTRRSELVSLRDSDMEPQANGTYRFLIRRSKSDPFGAGRLAFCSKRTSELLEDWLAWRGEVTDWLFCPIYQDLPLDRSLSATTVKRVVHAAAQRCCDPDIAAGFSGHSMRVGAAQDLLKRGVDTAGIMRAGGWKSVNILARYLEYADHNPWL
jgi:integrase/recombinase XerD